MVGGLSSILFREINEGRVEQIRDIVPDMVDFVALPLQAIRARVDAQS